MDDKLKNTGAGALALAGTLAGIDGAAGFKTAYELYGFLIGRATDERTRALTEGLLAEVALLARYDKHEAESRFTELLHRCSHPDVENLIYDMHRTVFFGRSKESWPYILRLTADYIVNRDGVPDPFSRRVAWLLERSEEDDIEVLQELASRTRKALHAHADAPPSQVGWTFVEDGVTLTLYIPKETPVEYRAELHPCGRRDSDTAILLRESRLLSSTAHENILLFRMVHGNLVRLIDLFAR